MSDELLKKLQSRRSFLKGSALLAASVVAVPAVLSAQDTQSAQADQDKKDKDQNRSQDDQRKDEPKDAPQQEAKEDDATKTFIGADGRPFRICPQCGSNMYKQERTWTCENCGYSYVE